jgi:AraC-like DNA-binding protein
VSQVINEQMGKNFNALLNEYRIQEACRRFNDIANYGNYTIEAIGNSVGYNSRSTFITQFKSVTGLTPSEFQKMAKEIR